LHDLDWRAAAQAMTAPVLFDGRNMFDPADMARAGFTYLSVGRATARPA